MLKKRLINSVLVLGLVFLVTFVFPNWAFALLASFLIGVSLYEFYSMVETKGILLYKYFGIAVGMTVPLVIYFQRGLEGYADLDPFIIVLACLLAFILQFTRRDNSQALASIAITTMSLLYISWFFSFFVKLKFMPNGAWLVTYLVLVTKSSDVGAYFIGRRFGKHSLIPRISPSKTVEGTVGGLMSSIVMSLAFKSFLPRFTYPHLLFLGILIGTLSQVGDLAESLLKRDCDVKDSGKNLAGFGGVFDVIDSLIFTVPIFYYYVLVVMR